jgi:2',3'-cyclic-nucleotide 2'-phosphodiesterase (5'-nucleotidase family)
VLYGYLSPYIFDFIKIPKDLNLVNFIDAKPEESGKECFEIAIIHGYLSNAEQFALENSGIDLILLAHDQRKGIWKKNHALIVGNGKDSEYISIIEINKYEKWNINVVQKKIHEELPEDNQIVKIIDEYKGR